MQDLWLLLDNRMGSVGQAKGVALKLENSFNIIEKQVVYNKLAKLPNLLKGKSLLGTTKETQASLKANFPSVVISASRRTAPIARWIKNQSPSTKIIQLMHPGNAGLTEFDLIFVPYHDKGNRKHVDNITYIFGAPHRLSQEKLSEAKAKWQKEFASLPKPLTAVLVGGGVGLDEKNAKRLGYELKNLKDKIGGSILITTSNRTSQLATDLILEEIKNIPSYQFIWGQTKTENPYLGYMACADNIVVTGDSVSMASEACGTGKPVFIFAGENWLKEKHSRFICSLFNHNYACSLEDTNIIDFYPEKTLDCAKFIAKKIQELF